MKNIEASAYYIAACAVHGVECHIDFDSPETAKKVFDRARALLTLISNSESARKENACHRRAVKENRKSFIKGRRSLA